MASHHNPTPWETEDAMILDADGKIIGKAIGDDTSGREDSDNAAFIVRACNAHDDLLAALIDARAQLQVYERDRSGEAFNDTQINAAIATATEGRS